jgi:hypothetical protein
MCTDETCPNFGQIEWIAAVWECKRCGEKEIFGSHLCPELHKHEKPPEPSQAEMCESLGEWWVRYWAKVKRHNELFPEENGNVSSISQG